MMTDKPCDSSMLSDLNVAAIGRLVLSLLAFRQ